MLWKRWSLSLLAIAVCGSHSASAQVVTSRTMEVTRWSSYGTAISYVEEAGVPGGTGLVIAARVVAGEPWSSAATLALPVGVRKGERLTATFWARASASLTAQATIQGGAPNYPVFVASPLNLTAGWHRFVVSGVAGADFAAGSQSLTVQLGQTRGDVTLGPAAVASGADGEARAAAAIRSLVPTQRVRDVAIASEGGVRLAGRLHVPTLPSGTPPPPVALLVAGSGASKRGVFSVLEEQLLAAGIATLDYDKRGVGESSGAFDDRLEPVEEDAAAAVAFVRRQHDVDGTRVAIVGLSQGGIVGPAVAARDGKIAAVVMLAGPVSPGPVLFVDQLQRQLVASGMKLPVAQRAGTALRMLMDAHLAAAPARTIGVARAELVDALVAGGWGGEQANGVVDTITNPVFVSMYAAMPDRTLAMVRAPVLALYAGEDDTVSTPLSLPAAKVALRGNRSRRSAITSRSACWPRQRGRPEITGPTKASICSACPSSVERAISASRSTRSGS